MKINIRLSLLLIMALFQSGLFSQDVKIALDENASPFSYRNEETGEAEGLYPRLLRELFNRIDIAVDITPLPWKRALFYSEKGESGIMGIYRTDERDLIYDYSDPIIIEKVGLLTSIANTKSPRTFDDLKNTKVGTLFGWSYGQDFEEVRKEGFFTVIEKHSDIANLDLLAAGRIDYILILEEIGETMMEREEYRGKFRMIYPALLRNETYLGFNKNAGKTNLLQKLNELIREMRQDDSYDSLVRELLQLEMGED